MSTFLDQLLAGGGGAASPFTDVKEHDRDDVTAPGAGAARLFLDQEFGALSLRLPDGRLRGVRADPLDLHVADFVAGGGYLDASNFDAALRAAVAHSNTLPRSSRVHIPAGLWLMSAAELTLPGRGLNSAATVLIGAGRDATILRWPATYAGVCVNLDGYGTGYGPGADDFYQKGFFYGGLQDLTISSDSAPVGFNDDGRGIGVLMRSTLWVTMMRVTVRGFGDYNHADGVDSGIGIWCDGNSLPGLQNNQNHTWVDVTVCNCLCGLRTRAGMFSGFGIILNQNRFCDANFDSGNFISIRDGMFQSAQGSTGIGYDGNPFHSIRTIGSTVVKSGTGATVAAPSGGTVTLTSLTGMVAADVGRWIKLSGASNALDNGVYEITAYLSATSVQIRKATGTGSTGVAYAVRSYDGGDIVEIGGLVYHEGLIQAFARLNAPEVSASAWKFSGIVPHNAEGFVEVDGNNRVTVANIPREAPSVSWIKARNCMRLDIGGLVEHPLDYPAKFDVDIQSREALTYHGQAVIRAGRTLTDLLAPAAAEIIDPGDTKLVTITGGYVQQIKGKLAASIIAAPSSGSRAVWIPAHPRMGGRPALGMRVTGNRYLSGTLLAPVPVGSSYGLFAILHLPTGYVLNVGAARGPHIQCADGSEHVRISVDASDGAAGAVQAYIKVAEGTAGFGRTLAGRTTVAVLLQSQVYDSGSTPAILTLDGEDDVATYGCTPRSAATAVDQLFLTGLPGFGYVANDIDIAYVAVLKRPLTRIERQMLWSLADPYRRDMGAAVAPVRTGTFTVDSVADARVLVDISGANAVPSLPPGRAGDKALFKVDSAASGHTCTITATGGDAIDAAGTLVLSTDRAWAQLEHNGAGRWLVTAKG